VQRHEHLYPHHPLQGARTTLCCSDPNGIVYLHDEDFAVADPARASGVRDGRDHVRRHLIGDYNFKLNLGQKINNML